MLSDGGEDVNNEAIGLGHIAGGLVHSLRKSSRAESGSIDILVCSRSLIDTAGSDTVWTVVTSLRDCRAHPAPAGLTPLRA
jgi:hypothetical protein